VTPLWLVPLTIIIDQVSKLIVRHTMMRGMPVEIVGDFFRLTYIHNPGAAFGFDLGSPLLHTAISIVALGALVYLYRTLEPDEQLLRFGLCLVLGGAVGNIIDRLYLHEVVDFFDFGFGLLRWPIFNFADTFVTVGVFLLVFGYSRKKEEGDETAAEPEGEAVRG
jgi:signal peptidase II